MRNAKYPNLKSLNTFYKNHTLMIFLFILFAALTSGIALAFPFASSRVIINLTGGNYGEMAKFALILFGLIACGLAFEMATDYIYSKTSNALFTNIRRETVKKTISMNLSAIYEKGSGFFLERLNEDCREVSVVFLSISRGIINLVINLTFIGYITVLNPLLGLLFAAGLALIIILEYVRVSRLLKNKKMQKRAVEKVKSHESEILKGIKEIKGLNARDAVIEKHTAKSGEYIHIKYSREIFEKKMQRAIDFVKAALNLAILLFAGFYLLPKGQAELAAVLVVYEYKGNIYELVAGLARIKDQFVNGELAAKRINDIVAAPAIETDVFGAGSCGDIKTIEFADVKFGYVPEQPVLNGVSFKIDKPGVYGFVGKSGSGKSTIFSLLAGFYKPDYGQILLNGVGVADLSENEVRGGITTVLQDPYMFNDTVMNNLLLARPDASRYEVEAACKAALIHNEIMAMPDGYDTVLGENGSTISGGQKQRIEIARAVIKGTKVMLFDEATSALDKNNLEKINNLIVELGKTNIIFVIAHRLGVMRRCDKVIVLDEGKIIAAGHHDELMKISDYYMNLFKKNQAAEQKNTVETPAQVV